jgi:hypothetical protein
VVSVGPSWRNQREATTAFVSSTAQNDPQGWALIRDIGARLMEPQLGHFADEIATRWTPPQFAQQDPNAPPLPPGVQQQMALVPQLTQRVNELHQVIQQKQVEEQGRYQREMAQEQMKFQTEQLKSSTQLQVAELQAKNDTYLAQINARVQVLEAMADRGHELQKQAHKQAHETGLAAMQHAHAMHQADAQHENEIDMAQAQPAPTNGSEAGAEAQA